MEDKLRDRSERFILAESESLVYCAWLLRKGYDAGSENLDNFSKSCSSELAGVVLWSIKQNLFHFLLPLPPHLFLQVWEISSSRGSTRFILASSAFFTLAESGGLV